MTKNIGNGNSGQDGVSPEVWNYGGKGFQTISKIPSGARCCAKGDSD